MQQSNLLEKKSIKIRIRKQNIYNYEGEDSSKKFQNEFPHRVFDGHSSAA